MVDIVRRAARNFFPLFIAQILAGFSHYAAIIYIARVLGPNEFGMISFAEAVLTYFVILSNLGIDILGVRDLGRNKERIEEKHFIGNIITLRLLLSFLSFSCLLVFLKLAGSEPQMKYLIIYYGLALFPLALFFDWIFQGIERMNHSGIAIIIREFLYLVLVVMFIKKQDSLLLVPVLYVIARIVSSGYLIMVFKRHYKFFSLKFDARVWIELLRQAIPLGISFFLVQIIYSSDILILGFLRSNEEVGYYNAAFKIILFLMTFSYIFNLAIFPIISHYFKSSKQQLEILISNSSKIMVIIALPMALGGTILATPLIKYFYGQQYSYGAIALQILLWSTALAFINGLYGRALLACERQRIYLRIVVLQTAINILTNIVLIPPLGISGSAFGVFLAEISGFYFYFKELNRIIQIPLREYILKPVMASFIMGFFLLFQRTYNSLVLVQIAGGIIVYSLFIYLFKGISADTIKMLKDAITARE